MKQAMRQALIYVLMAVAWVAGTLAITIHGYGSLDGRFMFISVETFLSAIVIGVTKW